jgi:hypothetical protein
MNRRKRTKEVAGISLPIEVFRIPMLTGSMEGSAPGGGKQ